MSLISRVMKEKNLYKTYTLAEVFYELKKLRVVTLNNGNSYLTEVSKKQRNLFEQFESSHSCENIVIKSAGF